MCKRPRADAHRAHEMCVAPMNIDMAQVITAEDVPEHSRTCQEPAQCSERLSARRVRSWLGMLGRGAKKADTKPKKRTAACRRKGIGCSAPGLTGGAAPPARSTAAAQPSTAQVKCYALNEVLEMPIGTHHMQPVLVHGRCAKRSLSITHSSAHSIQA